MKVLYTHETGCFNKEDGGLLSYLKENAVFDINLVKAYLENGLVPNKECRNDLSQFLQENHISL